MFYKIQFCDKPYPTYEYQKSKISERQNVYDVCMQLMYVNLKKQINDFYSGNNFFRTFLLQQPSIHSSFLT